MAKLLAARIAVPYTRRIALLAWLGIPLLIVSIALSVVYLFDRSKVPEWAQSAFSIVPFMAVVVAGLGWHDLRVLRLNRAVFIAAGAPEDFRKTKWNTVPRDKEATPIRRALAVRFVELVTADGRSVPPSADVSCKYVQSAWNQLLDAQEGHIKTGWPMGPGGWLEKGFMPGRKRAPFTQIHAVHPALRLQGIND